MLLRRVLSGFLRYAITSSVQLFSSAVRIFLVFASREQLSAFQACVIDPSHETPRTSPSSFDPSHLQKGILSVTTIQFPPWISGEYPSHGDFPTLDAGAPKHIAAPIPSVSVGVTKILRKFAFASTHNIHHAPFENILTPHAFGLFAPPTRAKLSARRTLTGHTAGIPIVHGEFPQVIVRGIHVSALIIGIHSSTFSPSHHGKPSIGGSFPGASGAQLSGKLIQLHHPNPH